LKIRNLDIKLPLFKCFIFYSKTLFECSQHGEVTLFDPEELCFDHAIDSARKVNLIMFDNCDYNDEHNNYQLDIDELIKYINN